MQSAARRTSRPLFVQTLAAALVLAGGLSAPLASSAQGTLPDSLSGELTTRSGLNVKDGSRYQTFELELRGGEMVRAGLEGVLSGAVLTLFDERQRVVGGPFDNTAYLLAPRDGRYTLAVSGENDRAYGPFTLVLETVEVNNGGPLTLGEEVFGVLPGRTAGNVYTLAVAEAGLYRLSLDSEEFDTLLRLKGEGLEMEDDDGAGNGETNSRLIAHLPRGSFQITASALSDDDNGAYTLRAERHEPPAGQTLHDSGEIELGTEIAGFVTAGGEAPVYTLTVPERGMLNILMRSSDVDSMLQLNGPEVDLSDDDGAGNGFDARILTLVEAGEYTIMPSSMDKRSGLFTLSTELTAVSDIGAFLHPGESVTGVLADGESATTTLRITTAGRYRIEFIAAGFDAYLRLQGNGIDQEDDDSAGGTDARLDLHLRPGDYRLTGSSFENAGGGRYMLTVRPLDN